ncbi:hypothetical protein AKJ16_DCAP13266 [Drosera capensis]
MNLLYGSVNGDQISGMISFSNKEIGQRIGSDTRCYPRLGRGMAGSGLTLAGKGRRREGTAMGGYVLALRTESIAPPTFMPVVV